VSYSLSSFVFCLPSSQAQQPCVGIGLLHGFVTENFLGWDRKPHAQPPTWRTTYMYLGGEILNFSCSLIVVYTVHWPLWRLLSTHRVHPEITITVTSDFTSVQQTLAFGC
jgi:hypothetical protein